MKEHPKSKLLIEQSKIKDLWRVVDRMTTWNGLSARTYSLIADNLPRPEARKTFEDIKVKHG